MKFVSLLSYLNIFFIKFRNWLKYDFYILKKGLSKENKIFTHLTLEEKVCLHKFLFNNKDKILNAVEIGSYLGASSAFIASALEDHKRVFCIDTWNNNAMSEGERDTYPIFCKNISKYKKRIVPLRGWSFDVIHNLKKNINKIDFLFIDGDHSYEGCKNDWDNYSKLLKNGFFIAFHDTGWADGVKKVIYQDVHFIADKIIELPNLQIFRFRGKDEAKVF
ncbi:hypothetical protein GF385_00070 [Candidatus Dependentiae bacterium]|nr:hypothetical protein [Candidatus Dependentiae bacterium]